MRALLPVVNLTGTREIYLKVNLSGRHSRGPIALGSVLCPRFGLRSLWRLWTNTNRSSGRDLTAFVRVSDPLS
ncbi:unnamed protein product [Pleuronectes platessa]|uniref:Uncharacterized protein n=1 Tax=Pleuronectes platessa TaxID=8262 RepID=A0A9N7TJI2_PLEPL|nr:unnamed protein product [Pleuronectes platessa]